MGTESTEIVEVVETLPYPISFKVHGMMCTELRKFVDRMVTIFPEIEAARPRCSSGIKALCSLNDAINRAKLFLQYCSESSKLYMAMKTDAIVSRCRKTKNFLEQCLCQVQSVVPVMLVHEISQIVDDLRAANFVPDKFEEEAGKVLRELLQKEAAASDSMEHAELKAFQTAASRLHITSRIAILIEKRSIKKLLEKASESDQVKKKILKYLLHLLGKYAKLIIQAQTDNTSNQNEGVHTRSADAESHTEYRQHDTRAEMLNRAIIPPEEFKCDISSRLMYDPVVIASGQTFERTWIQKWFDEGNDTCPKTKMKLDHLSLIPNDAMEDLITKWCRKYGITIQKPSIQPDVLRSLENSSTSIASFGSSMNDLHFQLDISNMSLGSLDTSYTSDGSLNRIEDGSSPMHEKTSDDLRRYQSLGKTNVTNLECLSVFADLDRETQYKMVEDMKNQFKRDDLDFLSLSCKNFIEPLIKFLSSANDLHDIRAQRAGLQLLSTFLSKNRDGILYLNKDAYSMLSVFIDSGVTREVLDIMLVLSEHSSCGSKVSASGALVSMLNILNSNIKDFQEQILTILRNLSSSTDICSDLISLECIPKLVPYLQDTTLARHCIVVFRNLCSNQEAWTWITGTSGCIASIATLLETGGGHEGQEHAVAILLTLCSQSIRNCLLVMDECCILPLLFEVSVSGSEKGKASAMELLRLLRDTKHDTGDDDEQHKCSNSDVAEPKDANNYSRDKKSRKTLYPCQGGVFFLGFGNDIFILYPSITQGRFAIKLLG
ncbi:hypothetical protein V6N13_024157 [Hibiscus sabdariffa]